MCAELFITADAPYAIFEQAFKVKMAEQMKAQLQMMGDSFVQMGADNPTLVVKKLLAEMQAKVDQEVADLQSATVLDAAVISEYTNAKAAFQQMKDNLPFLGPAGMSEGLPPGMDVPNPEVVFQVLMETYEVFAALCDKVTGLGADDNATGLGADDKGTGLGGNNDDVAANEGNEVNQVEEPKVGAPGTLAGDVVAPVEESTKENDSSAVVVVVVDDAIIAEPIELTNGEPPAPVLDDASIKGSDAAAAVVAVAAVEPTEEVSLSFADKLIEEVVEEVIKQVHVEQEEKPNVPLEGPVTVVTSVIAESIPIEPSLQPDSTQPTSSQPASSPIAPLTTAVPAIIAPPKNNLPSEAEREALLASLDFSNPRFLR